MVTRTLYFLTLASLSSHTMASELTQSIELQALTETRQANHSGLVYPASDSRFNQIIGDWNVRFQDIELALVFNGKRENSTDSGTESELIIKELFWQGATGDWDWIAGKRRLDYGVGYGFRPLDMFYPYQRNPVGLQVEEGVAVFAGSIFSDSGEFSILFTDSQVIQQEADNQSDFDQQGLGVRWYELNAIAEWQTIAYWDDIRGLNLGGSITNTFSDHWEFHGESRYQHKYQSWHYAGELNSVPAIHEQHHGFTALAGFTWASISGHNLIGEYWFDNRSWSENEWRQLFKQANSTEQLPPEFSGLRSALALPLQVRNLTRHSVLLHWHMNRDSAAFNTEPSIDVIISPDDGSIISTARLDCEISQGWHLGIAARFFGGKENSVAQHLPDRRIINLNIAGRF